MNVRDKPEYVCQKCKERFKISTKMVQHYAKEHKDSDLERTKEDLLLYSSDELEEHYRNDVKVNWKTGMESCEKFSNDNVNIETIGKEILFRREMCKNMGPLGSLQYPRNLFRGGLLGKTGVWKPFWA